MIYETLPQNVIPRSPNDVLKDVLETFQDKKHLKNSVIAIPRFKGESEINNEFKDMSIKSYLRDNGIDVEAKKKNQFFVIRISEDLRKELNK